MKTFSKRIEDVKEKWYIVDAKDQILGRLAGQIARVLRGKHRPDFTPHIDGGDYVVVVNCEKVQLTGKKAEHKKYYSHSLYPGGLKETSFDRMLDRHPERIIKFAVKGMLPKNKLQSQMLKKLRIYSGDNHPHAPQKPEVLTFS